VVGFVIAVILQLLIYGEAATLLRASLLPLGVYGLTMVRRYILRRIFCCTRRAVVKPRKRRRRGGLKSPPKHGRPYPSRPVSTARLVPSTTRRKAGSASVV